MAKSRRHSMLRLPYLVALTFALFVAFGDPSEVYVFALADFCDAIGSDHGRCQDAPKNYNCEWITGRRYCRYNCSLHRGNEFACRKAPGQCMYDGENCISPTRCFAPDWASNETNCERGNECLFDFRALTWDYPAGFCRPNCSAHTVQECSQLPEDANCVVQNRICVSKTDESYLVLPCHRRSSVDRCSLSPECQWSSVESAPNRGYCMVNCAAFQSEGVCQRSSPRLCTWAFGSCQFESDQSVCELIASVDGSCPNFCIKSAGGGSARCGDVRKCESIRAQDCPSVFCNKINGACKSMQASSNTTATTSRPTTRTTVPPRPTNSTQENTTTPGTTIPRNMTTSTPPTRTSQGTSTTVLPTWSTWPNTTTPTPSPPPSPGCASYGLDECPRDRCRPLSRLNGCFEMCPPWVPHTCDYSAMCSASQSECMSCPSPQIQCWDSSCRDSFARCPCLPGQFRCQQDGRCVKDERQCVSVHSTCVAGFVACPDDGSCQRRAEDCPCGTEAPIQCNWPVRQCAAKISDCDMNCPFGQARCWDGSCVEDRELCPCAPQTPYRCPMNASGIRPTCVASLTDCPCPVGTIRCQGLGIGCVANCEARNCLVTCPDGTCAQLDGSCRCSMSMSAASAIIMNINASDPLAMDVNTAFDFRVLGSVYYSQCGIDLTRNLTLSWTLFNAKGNLQAQVGRQDSSSFYMPAYTISGSEDQWYRLVFSANYTRGPTPKTASVSLAFRSISPRPTASIMGGSVVRVSAGQPNEIRAAINLPCNTTSDATCASSGSGLLPYECNSLYPAVSTVSKCISSLKWSCAPANARSPSCSHLFNYTSTLYRGIVMADGEYIIALKVGDKATATQRIVVVSTPSPLPTVSLRCTGQYTTENLECFVATDRKLAIHWSIDGVAASDLDGQYQISVPITAGLSLVMVTAIDTTTKMYNNASYAVSPLRASLICSHNGNPNVTYVGYSSKITVRCAVDVEHEDTQGSCNGPQVSFYYKTIESEGEKILSPFALMVPVFTFVVPPINTTMEVVAQLTAGGRIIATVVAAGSQIRVAYPPRSFPSDLSALTLYAAMAKNNLDTTSAVTAVENIVVATSTMVRSPTVAATTDQLTHVISVVVDTLYSVYKSSGLTTSIRTTKAAPLSDSQVVSAATSLSTAVLFASEYLTVPQKTSAIYLLNELSPGAALHGGPAVRAMLLFATFKLGPSDMSEEIAKNVATVLCQGAKMDGSQSQMSYADESGEAVSITSSRFVSTDAGSRRLSVGRHSVALPADFSFSKIDPDSSKAGGITGLTCPTAYPNSFENHTIKSNVVQFNLRYGDQQYQLTNQTASPVNITLYVGDGLRATSDFKILYWDTDSSQWSDLGVHTTGPCIGSNDEDAEEKQDPTNHTHVCGTTAHFTAFAVFEVDPGSSNKKDSGGEGNSNLAFVMGGIVAGVFIIAVATVVAVKINNSRKERTDDEMDYNASQFDMSDEGQSSTYEMRLIS